MDVGLFVDKVGPTSRRESWEMQHLKTVPWT